MNIYYIWLSTLPRFFVLLPAAASCYLPARGLMKYTPIKTAALCGSVLVPFSLAGAWMHATLKTDVNTIIFPSLIVFFFLYRHTVKTDLPKTLSIYVGVCAIETFPAQFAYALDAHLHPLSNTASFSASAALFQFGLSCILMAAFASPARHQFSWVIEHLDSPKIWYSTLAVSSVFLIANVGATPQSYLILHTGRLSYLFPTLEGCALVLLVTVYVLFYWGGMGILEHARLEKRSQLLEIQAHQYQALQNHMQQTKRLRHDFRHSVRLLASLAEKGDLESIRAHINEYENRLSEHSPINYCTNITLNALFGYYHEMAVSAGVSTDWRIELPETLTVSDLDMAALFGNLIENAIEGCRNLPENKRYFNLTAEIRHGNQLYIVSTNRFDGKIRKDKDGYLSTKHSGKGTGLVSIAAVAEKYQGSAQVSHNDREFFVDVVIKL